MPKLNDTQTLLLSHAAKRDSGAFYPLPETCNAAGARATKAIVALLEIGFAEKRETSDTSAVSRSDGDIRYGTFITAAGLAAIGIEPAGGQGSEAPDAVSAPTPKAPSKSAAVVTLLRRVDGATLPELIAATGWLPHTTRAALTGLRKKGHALERSKRGGVTCYRIATSA